MAESSPQEPLLHHYHHHHHQELTPEPQPAPPKLDKAPSLDESIEKCMGEFCAAQLLQSLLVSFAWTFDAQQTFISIFADAQPSWHRTGPFGEDVSMCEMPRDGWAWDRARTVSVVSEWELVCGNASLAGLPASCFFAGCLAGGLLLASLADSVLGRKNMLLISCLAMSLTGLLTAVSPNIWFYSALRFISGFGRATIGTCALVLSTELVGKRWRGEVGIMGFFCFTFGFLSLPAMAYMTKAYSWRLLYLFSSLPALIYCILVKLIVRESPRWLLVRGRKEEAFATIRSISVLSAKSLDLNFNGLSRVEEAMLENHNEESVIKVLWDSPWALRRLVAVMLAGAGVGMIYYGMPLGLGNLNFNLYLSTTFNALTELPSALLIIFLISKLNRRSTVLFFSMLSGVTSLACVFLKGKNGGFQMVAELVSFFSACTAFNVLMIYCLELFPTCIRNSALSLLRQAIVFGGIFSPMLAVAGRKQAFMSFGVFGLAIGCCGLFVMGLPETRGSALCDTMEEQENKEVVEHSNDNNA